MKSKESEKDKQPAEGWLGRTDFAGRFGARRRPSPREYRREGALADWVGKERKNEVFASLRPETESLNSLLDGILENFADDDLALLERLRGSWRELLGEVIAEQTYPVDLKDGILFLEVNNSAWMYVFERQHKPKIRKILLEAGNGVIRDLQFVQRGRFSR